ncbi:hypothetical protein C8T65DRAFT_727112 [Cerioporus squamosus]|nr:hypothetical protein C8T65DRAFT_727112 [Cerioporus squamosus]
MVSSRSPFVRVLPPARVPVAPVVTECAAAPTRAGNLTTRFAVIIELQEVLYVDAERKGRYYYYYVYEVEDEVEEENAVPEQATRQAGQANTALHEGVTVIARTIEPTTTAVLDASSASAEQSFRAYEDGEDLFEVTSPSRIRDEELDMVKAFLQRRAREARQISAGSHRSRSRKRAKSLRYKLAAYRCEKAINEVCSRLDIVLPFKAAPKHVPMDRQVEGFAGVVEEGTLGPANEVVDDSAQRALERMREELNLKRTKMVCTVAENRSDCME